MGALLVNKKESKKSKSSKHHRKSSVDSKDEEIVKVPKLKIRLGPKPESAKAKRPDSSELDRKQPGKTNEIDAHIETNVQDNSAINKPLDSTSELDGVCAKKGDNQEQSDEVSMKSLKSNASVKSTGDVFHRATYAVLNQVKFTKPG